MRALVLETHGGLENLKLVNDRPIPALVEGHVLIRVRASSFNYHDVFTVRGMPGIKVPLPVVIGLDMAGEIADVGPGVKGWHKGDRVLVNPLNKKRGLMGEMMDGGMAQYCLVEAEQLIRMPELVSFEDAASEGGVDVVVNFTGGDTWVPSLRCLKRGGKLLVCGATAGHDPKEDLRYLWSFELQVIGSNSFYDDNLADLMRLISEQKLKPVVDRVLPLDQAVEGLRLIEDREVLGKVVITP
jgi:NADPH:quinone reductase-like Zn-dependent oxidoreductase